MSDSAVATTSSHHPPATAASVSYILAAAVLIGLGLFAVTTWLVTFNWLWFLGFVPVVLGGLLLFNPRTGPDRAE